MDGSSNISSSYCNSSSDRGSGSGGSCNSSNGNWYGSLVVNSVNGLGV